MSRVCSNCNSPMINDCDVHEYMGCNVVISKKGEEFFNKISRDLKACVCFNCGNVNFYVDDSKNFKKFLD